MAVTVNEPAVLMLNVVLVTLVMAEAWFTVSVKLCVALVPTPLWAVKVMGKASTRRWEFREHAGRGVKGDAGRQRAGLA